MGSINQVQRTHDSQDSQFVSHYLDIMLKYITLSSAHIAPSHTLAHPALTNLHLNPLQIDFLAERWNKSLLSVHGALTQIDYVSDDKVRYW